MTQLIPPFCSGRSKGYGFVDLKSHEEQTKALETIKDMQVEGRTLYLSVALAEAPQEAGDASN
jgi:RNA recognition motif-containing protein